MPARSRQLAASFIRGALASKDEAYSWAMETIPPTWRAVIPPAPANRLNNADLTTRQLEQDAISFVEFVTGEVTRRFEGSRQT